MATVGEGGEVNTAVYAAPHVVDDTTLAWGMTPGRTHENVVRNRGASFLYFASGVGMEGIRLTLRLLEVREDGVILDRIRERTRDVSEGWAADALKYVAYFTVLEARPLQ